MTNKKGIQRNHVYQMKKFGKPSVQYKKKILIVIDEYGYRELYRVNDSRKR